MKTRQGGGFAIGLIVGLLIGLVLALGVAMYVTKVPVPFVNKVPPHSPEQDAAEAERNKNWDPNAPLRGEAPTSRAPAAAAPSSASVATSPPAPTLPPAPMKPPPSAGVAVAPTQAPVQPVLAPARPERGGTSFFAQAGAFSRVEDAQAQRAKLTLMGLDAKITEREQAGRTVYRVRVGPFDKRPEADAVIAQLRASSVEASLVRVDGR